MSFGSFSPDTHAFSFLAVLLRVRLLASLNIESFSMLQQSVHLQFLISLALISSTSAAPAPPPLEHRPIHANDKFWHSWRGWDPGSDFQASMLGAYTKTASEEVSRLADILPAKVRKADRPGAVSSLLVKSKGIYSASDYGNIPSDPKATLHPKTQNLFDACDYKPNRYGGYCSCIQALDGFHSKFPDDEIPRGSALASYGYRGDHPYKKGKILRPCKGTKGGVGCIKILNAAGIECIFEKRPLTESRDQDKLKKPRLD